MIYFLTVNYYSTNLVTKLIGSIQSNQDIPYKIVIVNNSPEDDSIYLLKSESVFIIEAGNNLGYGSACNLGLNWIYAQESQAIIWIINPDAYLIKTFVENVDLFFANCPEVSIVGTTIYTPNAEVWFASGYFNCTTGTIWAEKTLANNKDYTICDWVSGCSLLINLYKFCECPQFDSTYFLYYEDFDFCRRYASLGHVIAVTNQLNVVHQPSTITNRNIFNKIKYSTYSYLLTLEKYTSKLVLVLRFTRLIFHALVLMLGQPKVAFGKLYGVFLYLRRSLRSC